MKSLFGEEVYWLLSHDMDPTATALADRHYSRRHPGARTGFMGPGEKIVLISPGGDALFGWLYAKFRGDHIDGVNCTIFRNEGRVLSSTLILEAERFATNKWPGKKLFTYVSKTRVKSPKPGWCFIKAGWRTVGENKTGDLILLMKEPERRCSVND